jgi:hypothetical protein
MSYRGVAIMVRRDASVLLAVLLIGSCASLPPECKTSYAHTLSQCMKPKRQSRDDTIKVCQGNTGQTMNCQRAPRDQQIRDIKQQLPKPY